jgi:4-aminobutyrate aminotransferase-like enzyme
VLRRELDAVAARLRAKTFVRSLGLLGALEVEAPTDAREPERAGGWMDRWGVLGKELAERRLSLHIDGKRGTAIFAPPLCITERELVDGIRSFSEAAALAFGDAAASAVGGVA